MSIYIDITEFMKHPHRTGIQRVTGELCRSWPGAVTAHLVWVRSNGDVVRLPDGTLRVISEYFKSEGRAATQLLRRIEELVAETADAPGLCLKPNDVLLCPEVFFDPVRVAFYRNLGPHLLSRSCFVVYDLLPLTHPQFFEATVPHDLICQYYRLLRQVGNHAFISKATQNAFYSRLLRSDRISGIVARLGSDSLGPRNARPPSAPSNATFVVLGTIEPRKGHMIVLEAFESILEAVPGVELVFIGRIGWITSADRERLENFRESHPSFRLVTDADDETIRNCVSNARATIFVSAAEGFGLPPVESLWLGTPVIASKHLPSLEELGDEGVCIVDPLSSATVRDTAMALLDEAFYRTKVVQASRLDLPRWECFAHGIAEWTGAVHQSPIARP